MTDIFKGLEDERDRWWKAAIDRQVEVNKLKAALNDCPQCARFREKLNREKMELVILGCSDKPFFGGAGVIANAIIKHLTE